MSENEEEHTIAEDIVVTKYKMAGEIVNRVLKTLISNCVDGASVGEICVEGDRMLEEETGKVFKKEKDLKKGIAFPVCVSVNNCISNYSPLASEGETILRNDDVVKLDLGAHIDGFVAVVGHTFVIGASKQNKVTDRRADVILAAHYAAEAALRVVKPGNQNFFVTDVINKIAEAYKCKPVEGMKLNQLMQSRMDGEKSIILNPTEAQRKEVEKAEFAKHEVYGIDILISTAEGQGREMDARVTVFCKTDGNYSLKMKTSREFYSKVQRNYGTMPFNIRSFDDERKARMGVVECVNHKLLDPYPVLWEKAGEFVAQFKFTVLLMPNGQNRITGLPFDEEIYESKYGIDDPELKLLIKSSVSSKNTKKKKKKAEKEASQTVKAEEE